MEATKPRARAVEPQEPEAEAGGWLTASWPGWALAGLLVLAVAVYFLLDDVLWQYLKSNLETLQAHVQEDLVVAVLIFFVLYIAATAVSIPVSGVLTFTAGALFGRWLGTSVVSLASTTGATLALLSSRYLFRDWVRRRWGGRLEAIDRGIERDGAHYLFIMRLLPLPPYFMVNLGMGLTQMHVAKFAAVSWLGMLPLTFIYLNAGTTLAALETPQEILSPMVLAALALVGIFPLAVRKLLQRRAG